MNQRIDPTDSLDDFPTPPFATRALFASVLPSLRLSLKGRRVWEPAAGRGIMAAVLREAGCDVISSDVHRYPDGERLDLCGSFVGEGFDVAHVRDVDFVITNPPFALGLEFALRALAEAKTGVAFLCRSNWAEGGERYERLFRDHPPLAIAQFCERVPILAGAYFSDRAPDPEKAGAFVPVRTPAARGGYDPDASTATAYAWFIWAKSQDLAAASLKAAAGTRFIFIPPGQADVLTRPDDVRRFAKLRELEAAA